VTAQSADTDGKVSYADGVSLDIRKVTFGKEKGRGPGTFPGRAYAVLTMRINNKSRQDLSLNTVVMTVLDKSGKPVAPVYVQDAEVSDFAGTLRAGDSVQAKYAFAVPAKSRSKVTIVVDFDGVHTSAVFRGGLN